MSSSIRRLYVTWRNPSGSMLPVGLLSQHFDGDGPSYEFVYLKLAEQSDTFEPLPGLPDLHRRYRSSRLFPVFANRQMPRERPDYDAFVTRLDLDVEADPFEVLARSEGRRATDRIEVFAAPTRSGDQLVTLFFARGIRHLEGATEAIETLSEGDHLVLVDEPDNEFNPRAILLNTTTDRVVGHAPDYLVDTIHQLRDLGAEPLDVTVEHVNDSRTAPHMRLLCRLSAPWPNGYEPLSGPEFLPLP